MSVGRWGPMDASDAEAQLEEPMADAKIQPTAVPAQPLAKAAATTAGESTTATAEGKKWPASTTLSDLKKSTFCALFERNCL